MPKITNLTSDFAVAGAVSPQEFAEIAKLGFRTVVNNRPDSEVPPSSQSDAAREAAEAAGLAYIFLPVTKFDVLTDAVIEQTANILAEHDGPILAHCASGQRSAIVWAALQARSRPVDNVLADLRAGGLKLDFLRDDLEAQADRARWNAPAQGTPPTGDSVQAKKGSRAAA